MRPFALSLVLSISAASSLTAQAGVQGRWGIGTSVRAAVDIGGGTPNTWGVDLAPGVSYFVIPDLALEGSFRVGYYTYGTGSKQIAAIGPGLTWYPLHRTRSVSPFLGAQLRYTGYSEESEDMAETRVSGWEWRTRGGLLLRLGSAVGLELGALYERSRFRMDQSNQLEQLPHARLGALLGVQFFF